MITVLHRPFVALAERIGGASPDDLKLVFSFFLSYPLAGLLKRIPDSRPYLKNGFIILTSLTYLVGLFDLWDGLRTIVISAGAVYCLAKFFRTNPYMPWLGFAFVMLHLSVSHTWRQIRADPSFMDITGAQMVMVMKLSAFCWNVADGQLPDDQLSPFQRDRRLRDVPHLLDYTAYVLFFPSLFAGPAFDYAEYARWLDTSMFEVPAHVEPSKKPPVRKKRRIPRSGTPATWKALGGLVWIGLYMMLSGAYTHDQLLSDSYMEHGLSHRVLTMYLVSLVARFKYYGVWFLTEGSCILAGLGYRGVDPVTGKVSWDRLQNIDPWVVETAQNARGFLAGWNMNTNNWLRNYVYLRVTPVGKKPGFRASLITFVTSALWHGFYPGYYLTFVLASFIQTAAKNVRRNVRPFFLDPITGGSLPRKKFYDAITMVITQLTFAFASIPFLLLTFNDSVLAWARVYFYAVIWTAASLLFFLSPGKTMLKKRLEKRQGRANVKLIRTLSTESLTGKEPILGISKDPEQDINEAVLELMAEVGGFQADRKKKQQIVANVMATLEAKKDE